MLTIRDALGGEHPCGAIDARIVCLVPSITELLCDLGLADRLVGRTGFCIHPRETVRGIAKVGGTKDVDLDRVRELAPTHVIVNVDENRRETADALRGFVPHVVVTHPLAPRDNLDLYRLCGALFGREAEAAALCARFEAAYARAEAAGRGAPPRDVLYLIWKDPWMTVSRDTYIARTLALVGWQTLPADAASRYPSIDIDAAAVRDASLVLLSTEPFMFREHHVAAVRTLTGKPVLLVDGEMTSWYGSRAVAGLDYVASLRQTIDAARG